MKNVKIIVAFGVVGLFSCSMYAAEPQEWQKKVTLVNNTGEDLFIRVKSKQNNIIKEESIRKEHYGVYVSASPSQFPLRVTVILNKLHRECDKLIDVVAEEESKVKQFLQLIRTKILVNKDDPNTISILYSPSDMPSKKMWFEKIQQESKQS